MGGGHVTVPTTAATPSQPTRSSAETQALAAAQSQRFAAPGSFTNTMLSGSAGSSLGIPTGVGTSVLGG